MPYISGGGVPIDVICQHKKDGSIIPIKIKLSDEDGESHIFKINAYRPLTQNGTHLMPNGVPLANHIWSYECKICMFGLEKSAFLFYNTSDGRWSCRLFKYEG